MPEKFSSKQVDEIVCSLEVSFFSQQSLSLQRPHGRSGRGRGDGGCA